MIVLLLLFLLLLLLLLFYDEACRLAGGHLAGYGVVVVLAAAGRPKLELIINYL